MVGDFEEGCFCAVVGTEAGLEGLIQSIAVKVQVKLVGNYFLKNFGEVNERWGGRLLIGFEPDFFGMRGCGFECRRNNPSGK